MATIPGRKQRLLPGGAAQHHVHGNRGSLHVAPNFVGLCRGATRGKEWNERFHNLRLQVPLGNPTHERRPKGGAGSCVLERLSESPSREMFSRRDWKRQPGHSHRSEDGCLRNRPIQPQWTRKRLYVELAASDVDQSFSEVYRLGDFAKLQEERNKAWPGRHTARPVPVGHGDGGAPQELSPSLWVMHSEGRQAGVALLRAVETTVPAMPLDVSHDKPFEGWRRPLQDETKFETLVEQLRFKGAEFQRFALPLHDRQDPSRGTFDLPNLNPGSQ